VLLPLAPGLRGADELPAALAGTCRVGLMSGTDPFEASARLPELADALLFLPRVTPLREDV
jgi:hypothetical protein